MKHPRLLLGLLPLGLWAAFALPDLLVADGGPWSWRRHLILLSGIAGVSPIEVVKRTAPAAIITLGILYFLV